MYQHMILMCSDYTGQKRIAFHKCYKELFGIIDFEEVTQDIKMQFEKIKFSFHHIPTELKTSESVVEYDPYFKEVIFYEDIEVFTKQVKGTLKLDPMDIVKYMLLKKELDQLQIQKLLYLVYERYVKCYGTPLFDKKIYVWKHGPVIKEVYSELKDYKKEKIVLKQEKLQRLRLDLKLSTIYHREEVCKCIDDIIEEYGNETGINLVNITHKEGTPWSIAKKSNGINSVIGFELIRDYIMSDN